MIASLLVATAAVAAAAAPVKGLVVAPADLLNRFAGVWEATMQLAGAPDGAPLILNGVEVNTLGGGGLYVVSDFRSQLDGRPFQGHAILAWDATTGRFRRAWADSTSPSFWISEGTWSPATGTLTMWIETSTSDGHPVRWREETVFKDDTRTFTMYVPGPDTVEAAGITIAYRRRATGEPPRPPAGPPPQPASPEHAVLAQSAGRWDARMEDRGGRGGSSKGTEVDTLCCDGRFLIVDYTGAGGKKAYSGHGLLGYNPATQQYEGAWIDSGDRVLQRKTGTYDAASGTLTLALQTPDGQGGIIRWRQVEAWDGHDQRSTTYSVTRPGAAESTLSVVRYRRAL